MVSAPLSADIGSFQQHGSAFWDVQGPYRTLHQINPARLQFVERFVVLSGLSVLDGRRWNIASNPAVMQPRAASRSTQSPAWRCWSTSPTRRRSCAIFMRC